MEYSLSETKNSTIKETVDYNMAEKRNVRESKIFMETKRQKGMEEIIGRQVSAHEYLF